MPAPNLPTMPGFGPSSTPAATQLCRPELWDAQRLKIIQVQVGHECDSSTAIYTHVSDDFMNTMLRKALAPALDPAALEDKDH